MTSFQHCVELHFSNAQVGQALKSETSVFPPNWIASDIAGHEDCDFVSVILSSKSLCNFWFPNQESRCTFQLNKVECTLFTHFSGPNASRLLQSLICLGPNMKVTRTQICIVLHLLSSKSTSFYRLTPTCLVVYSLSWCSHCIQIH